MDERIYKGVKTQLKNAWRDGVLVDEKGWIWVKKEKLHTILRTNVDNARYIAMKLPSEDKQYFNGEPYIRGFQVVAQLAKEIEENGVGKRGLALIASKEFYESIYMCDTVVRLRLEYDKDKAVARRTLKKKRKKTYNVKYDELTGDPLKLNCEFSHIRSYAIYKQYADDIDNGLMVNKMTHRLITERGVNDENKLLALCQEQGWKTDWYEAYINKFRF